MYYRKYRDKKRNATGTPQPMKEKTNAPIIKDGKSVFISSGYARLLAKQIATGAVKTLKIRHTISTLKPSTPIVNKGK